MNTICGKIEKWWIEIDCVPYDAILTDHGVQLEAPFWAEKLGETDNKGFNVRKDRKDHFVFVATEDNEAIIFFSLTLRRSNLFDAVTDWIRDNLQAIELIGADVLDDPK